MLEEQRIRNSSTTIGVKSGPMSVLNTNATLPTRTQINSGGRRLFQDTPLKNDVTPEADDDDVLWPLPGHQQNHNSSSPSPTPMLSHSPNARSSYMTSPRPHRHRAHTTDNVTFPRHNSAPIRHVPKDPIQPKQGSIQDIHSSVRAEEEDDTEEGDVFSDTFPMRPRSSTCPASMNRARRVKLRSMRRPPTPPPMDLVDPVVIDPSRMRGTFNSSIQEESGDMGCSTAAVNRVITNSCR